MNLQRATLNFQALSMGTDVLGTVPSKHVPFIRQEGAFLSQGQREVQENEAADSYIPKGCQRIPWL